MRIIGFALSVPGMLAIASVAGASTLGLVVNGDFEEGYRLDTGFTNVPVGWSWTEHDSAGTGQAAGDARIYKSAAGGGVGGGSCPRLRIITGGMGASILYQVIPTTANTTYTFSAQWRADCQATASDNEGWIGALFFDDNGVDSPGTQVLNAIPEPYNTTSASYPFRRDPNNLSSPPTDVLVGPNQEIVAERAFDYGMEHSDWESIYDAARDGADNQLMTQIGTAGNGAAWQTKTAAGSSMIVAFFMLDSWNGSGSGEELWIDNVSVTPEPAALALLALGMLPILRRRR